jgi:ABC-2 type transport system ATP-binding protein
MPPALHIKDFRKQYGAFQAVKGISFDVAPGEIFALIGPNGAGKSTTLRTVATLLSPTEGTIEVGGHDVRKEAEAVRAIISYLPEEAGAYKNLSGLAYLKFMAALYSDDSTEQQEYVERAKAICNLGDRLTDKVSTYSKGMSRKVLLARAVMTRPTLTILDEPTSGLDIINAREIRTTIRSLTQTGTAVLLSSHNMLEIEYLSDRVGIIHEGTLHETGTAAALKKKYDAPNLEEVFVKATGHA